MLSCALVFALAILSSSAYGAVTGLNIVPTADVLPDGTLNLAFGSSSPFFPFAQANCLSSEYGLSGSTEVGLDGCFSGSAGAWVNAKLRLQDESARRPALAIGVQNIGIPGKAQPFIVGGRTVGRARFHLGAIGVEGKARGMFGIDADASDILVLQADYTSGNEGFATLGLSVQLGYGIDLLAARLVSNSTSEDNGYLFQLGWTTRLR